MLPDGGQQMNDASAVRTVWQGAMILGEGTLYSVRENALYWVDIKRPAVYRLDLAQGSVDAIPMPDYVGWLVERAGGGFVAGLRRGVAYIRFDPLTIDYIAQLEADKPSYRLNDGKAHPNGSVYFGTMDNDEQDDRGSLYRLHPDGRVVQLDSGYRVTNGPAFSVDGRRMYTPDSALAVVYCFDVTADGGLANKRELIRFKPGEGYPDGMTVDAEDRLWIAHFGGARVSRFAPDGALIGSIALPAANITNCAFAGVELDRLFATSASIGLDDEQRAKQPLAGSLFEVSTGVRGLAPALFAG
jgi:sugar lactone lactonase YvrE